MADVASELEQKLKTLDPDVRKRAVKISASVMTSDPWVEDGQVQPDVNTLTRLAALVRERTQATLAA